VQLILRLLEQQEPGQGAGVGIITQHRLQQKDLHDALAGHPQGGHVLEQVSTVDKFQVRVRFELQEV